MTHSNADNQRIIDKFKKEHSGTSVGRIIACIALVMVVIAIIIGSFFFKLWLAEKVVRDAINSSNITTLNQVPSE